MWLDHEGLARAAPTKRTGVLLRQMRGAQYFEVFARERLDAIASALKAGEEVLYKDVDFDTEMDDYAEMYDAVRQSAARASAAAASYASYGYKKSAEYYSSFVKSSYEAYTENAVGASTPQKVKRVAVPGLGLRTVASPSSTFSPAAGSPWEDSAERFRQATVQVAGSDGGDGKRATGATATGPGGDGSGVRRTPSRRRRRRRRWGLLEKSGASGCRLGPPARVLPCRRRRCRWGISWVWGPSGGGRLGCRLGCRVRRSEVPRRRRLRAPAASA